MSDLKTYHIEQRSPEWLQLRAGMVTASTVGRLITTIPADATTYDCPDCKATAGSPCISLSRKTPTPVKTHHPGRTSLAAAAPPSLTLATGETADGLIHTLAAERITGQVETTPMTSDMWRGIDSEPFARDHYSAHIKAEVEEVGFMVRDLGGAKLGLSPDGLVGDDGCIEIKSPRAKTHVATIIAGEIPAHYMAQVQAALLVSGRKWCDFISFSGGLALWPKRIYPDPAWQAVIRAATLAAEQRITDIVTRYKAATDGLPMTDRIPDYAEIQV